MAADARLRASALLALTKLMAVDSAFCDANLRLVFTLLQSKCGTASFGASTRCLHADEGDTFPANRFRTSFNTSERS